LTSSVDPLVAASKLVELLRTTFEQHEVPAWIQDSIVVMIESWEDERMPSQAEVQAGAGFVTVGHNDRGEVVVNLDRDRTGYIVFSPQQARDFASLLARRAKLIQNEMEQS
jgi:hypothetical protein